MSRPAWMIESVIGGLQDLVATLDAIAAAAALDPTAAAAVSVDVAVAAPASLAVPAVTAPVVGISAAAVALYNMLPLLVSGPTGIDPSVVPALFQLARGLGGAMTARDAVAAFAAAVDALPDAAPSPTASNNRVTDAANRQIVVRVSRMVLLAPYAEALVRVDWQTRPEGVTARADCVERFEREIALATGPGAGDDAVTLTDLRNRVVDYLSRQITTLTDVVSISAKRALPSVWWAWRLYQDPSRAAELVARNAVPHPQFMPTRFDALAR